MNSIFKVRRLLIEFPDLAKMGLKLQIYNNIKHCSTAPNRPYWEDWEGVLGKLKPTQIKDQRIDFFISFGLICDIILKIILKYQTLLYI